VKAIALFIAAVALFGTLAAKRDEAPLSATAIGYRLLGESDIRLATIGYNLARANAPFCKLKSANPGWVLHDIAQYGDAAAVREAYDFRADISVLAVVDGGPAAQAGVAAGDGLLARNGSPWEWSSAKAKRLSADRFEQVRAELSMLLAASDGATLQLATANGPRTLKLQPPPVCKSDFWVDVRKKRDAGADGSRVRVTTGLIDYVLNDDELAAVVAHEMAHNILGHRDRIESARSGKTQIVKATEEEADRLSVWLMANAGYDPEAAIAFWQRYGRATGLGIFTAPTHYRWQNRVAMLREEIIAIQAVPAQDGLRDPPLLAAHRAAR
jgi:beta-barrel assembly-enhancing protease